MNYLPFVAYVVMVFAAYIYDMYGNGINKITYDKDDKQYTTISIVCNIIYGLLLFYTCYINYEILPWVLTAITFVSFISVLLLNAMKVKYEYNKM